MTFSLIDFFEVACLLGATFLVNYVTADSKTNWAEGFAMVAFYFMIVCDFTHFIESNPIMLLLKGINCVVLHRPGRDQSSISMPISLPGSRLPRSCSRTLKPANQVYFDYWTTTPKKVIYLEPNESPATVLPSASTASWTNAVTSVLTDINCCRSSLLSCFPTHPIAYLLSGSIFIGISRCRVFFRTPSMSFEATGSPKVTLKCAPARGRYLFGNGRPSGINWSKPDNHMGITTGRTLGSMSNRPLDSRHRGHHLVCAKVMSLENTLTHPT